MSDAQFVFGAVLMLGVVIVLLCIQIDRLKWRIKRLEERR